MLQQSVLGAGSDYFFEGKYSEAEIHIKQQLEKDERRLGQDHPAVAEQLKGLAMAYHLQGKYSQAEPLLKRALAIYEKRGHAGLVGVLSMLAQLYLAQGNYSEVETLYLRVLSISEKSPGPDSQQVATDLSDLAHLYKTQGEYVRAEPLLKRSLVILEKKMREDVAISDYGNTMRGITPEVREIFIKNRNTLLVHTLSELAELYLVQGRYGEAEPMLKRSLAIYTKDWGSEHLQVTGSLELLARLYHAQGKYAEAETLYKRAIMIEEEALGKEHLQVATTLHNLAALYRDRDKLTESEPLFRRSLAIREKVLGPEHPDVEESLNNLAKTLVLQRRHALALPLYERARRIQIAVFREIVNLDDESQRGLLKAGYRGLQEYADLLAVMSRGPKLGESLTSPSLDAFVVVEQLRAGLAQAALAKAGIRAAAGNAASANLARNVQDLTNQRGAIRKLLAEEYGKASAERSTTRLENLQQKAQQLERDLAQATNRLLKEVPRYADLSSPDPIDVLTVRKLLQADEALISFFTLDARVLIWLIRQGQPPVYHDIEIKKTYLSKTVSAVREILDQTMNPDLPAGRLLPFNVAGSHAIHTALLAPLRNHLSGVKHLIIVPDEVLLPLPFAALVTQAEGEIYKNMANLYSRRVPLGTKELADYAKLPWLVKDYAITVVPSATSLRALRQVPRPAITEVEAFIGFGDPVLRGSRRERGGTMLASRGRSVAVDEIRRMNRLPGTRDELMAVANALGADPTKALYLAAQATEPMVRDLNASGRLGKARVVSFATHGLLAGELRGLRQPALVLTPPDNPSEQDDGLLSLDNILDLKLTNTDWVILSACNTAGADGSGEGLSGLARAFFFAGAKSLLVSHWSVDDRATQGLMTQVFRRYAHATVASRSEALRQGMLALMESAKGETAYFAHPFAWAPFFLVGER